MKKTLKKGFTIVELVIVIAVIAILAAVLIPTFSGVVGNANQSAALQTARSTLTNSLTMSSTATLPGETASGTYKTVILVDGYAFNYQGQQLEQVDYPQASTNNQLKHGATSTTDDDANFNAILLASQNCTAGYTKTTDETVQSGKTYYTTTDEKTFKVDETPTDAELKTTSGETTTVNYYELTSYTISDSIAKIIVDATDLDSATAITVVDGTYYLNYTAATGGTDATYDAVVYLNSDFSKKAVVFTTFDA